MEFIFTREENIFIILLILKDNKLVEILSEKTFIALSN